MAKRVKTIITLILVVALLCCLPVSAGADETGVCFVSANDTLLDLSLSPVYYGSTAYVSARIFSYFGIYYSYFGANFTAELYNESKQIFFDMEKGSAYDTDLNPYDVSAVYRNGVAYVPVGWVCRYFGLSYSVIAGKGSGDVLRIKNGAEVLNDSQFFSAASSLMESRYNDYYGNVSGGDDYSPLPEPTSQVSAKKMISLSFIGLPSAEIMNTLDRYGVKASFFLTERDALSDGDMLRRIVCSGHSIGVYCEGNPSEAVPDAVDAVFDASMTMPTMLTAPKSNESACSNYAADNAMSFFSSDSYSVSANYTSSSVISYISSAKGDVGLCFKADNLCEKNLPSILNYIASKDYSVSAVRETDK